MLLIGINLQIYFGFILKIGNVVNSSKMKNRRYWMVTWGLSANRHLATDFIFFDLK